MNETLHEVILQGERNRRKQIKSDEHLNFLFKISGNFQDAGMLMGALVLSYCVE